tara:strand:+ start:65 stop:199 length:135 start_codon:yes stop_codon:yes gene_type:complete
MAQSIPQSNAGELTLKIHIPFETKSLHNITHLYGERIKIDSINS